MRRVVSILAFTALACVLSWQVPAIGLAAPTYMWGNLQWPPSTTVSSGPTSELMYGRVYIEGVMPNPGPTPGLVAQLGYGPDGSDPTADGGGWMWDDAAFNWDVGNADEFMGALTVRSPAGAYDYAFRYSYQGGSWLYGDVDGSSTSGGGGSEDTYWPAMAGALTVTAATGVAGEAPPAWRLYSNQPNPFNPATSIRFAVASAARVRLDVYSLSGELVARLVDAELDPGVHQAVWTGLDASGLPAPSGVYLCRMESGPFRATGRMTLVK